MARGLIRSQQRISPGRSGENLWTVTIILLIGRRFLGHVTQRTREAGVRSAITVVRDAMDDQTYASLQRAVDTEIDLR